MSNERNIINGVSLRHAFCSGIVPIPRRDTERYWELYRLDAVSTWPDSDRRTATLEAIKERLQVIERASCE